jgi:hypothetical protein
MMPASCAFARPSAIWTAKSSGLSDWESVGRYVTIERRAIHVLHDDEFRALI